MLWGRVLCSHDISLHQSQRAWVVPALFLKDIVGEVYDLHSTTLGRWFFFTFLNWALSIVRLKKCFRSYRCHPGFTVVGVGVRVEMDPVHAQNYWMHPSLGKVLTARWHQAQGARKGQKVILTKDTISKSRTCCGSIKETLICFQGSRMGSVVKLTDVLTLWRNQTSILDPEGHPHAA